MKQVEFEIHVVTNAGKTLRSDKAIEDAVAMDNFLNGLRQKLNNSTGYFQLEKRVHGADVVIITPIEQSNIQYIEFIMRDAKVEV